MGGNREIIEEVVRNNIGITFSELKERTGLANGVLQHHIHNSKNIRQTKGAILPSEHCREECDLEPGCREVCIHKVLRDEVKKAIYRGLLEGRKQNELAQDLDLHKSTVSYHVKKLREAGLVEE